MTIGNGERMKQDPSSYRKELIELLVFLFLIVPSLIISLFVVQQNNVSFLIVALSTIFRDLSLVSLIVYFLWCNGQRLRNIGWTARNIGTEVGIGLLLVVPFYFGAAYLEQGLQSIGLTAPSSTPSALLPARTAGEIALAVILVIVVAISEETIFRGYLILRFEQTTKSVAAAVILSSFVFMLGHGYEGTAGLATVGTMGIVLAVIYKWRGSLVAPIVIHFVQDFVGIVIAPLVQGG